MGFSEKFKEGFWEALYEYLVIILPVTLFIVIESFKKTDETYIYKSPEWSIATIFLLFITTKNYASFLFKIGRSGKKVSQAKVALLSFVVLVLIIFASINAYEAKDDALTNMNAITRIIVFCLSTIIFFIYEIGKKISQ